MTFVNPLARSIGYKILAVVGVLGALALLAMGWYSLRHMEKGLHDQYAQSLDRLTAGASLGLQAIMLAGYADVAHNYADNLKKVPGVVAFSIMRVNGLEAFRDNATIDDVNKRMGSEEFSPRDEEREVRVLDADHAPLNQAVATQAVVSYQETGPDDEGLLTYLAPIHNQKPCFRCHGGKIPVRGVVKVTASLAGVEAEVGAARTRLILATVGAVAGFLVLLGVVLRNSLGVPLTRIAGVIQVIAGGDLTGRQRVPEGGQDELGRIASHVNTLAANLSNTIRMVLLESQNLFACVAEFVAIMEKLDTSSRNTHGIASNVVELNTMLGREITGIRDAVREAAMDVVSNALEQLSGHIGSIASTAEEASANVRGVSGLARKMSHSVARVNTSLAGVEGAVTTVSEAVQALSATLGGVRQRCQGAMQGSREGVARAAGAGNAIAELHDAAREIGNIVKVINEIAGRTNLLALNAAIESANAGEAGRGFGVVAMEVKELSLKTGEATGTIQRMVERIQSGTAQAGEAIDRVTEAIGNMDQAIHAINQAVDQQNQAIAEITGSMESVRGAAGQVMGEARTMGIASREVDEAAAETVEGTERIARLTAEAARGAQEIAARTDEARAFIMGILDAALRTDTVSGVVQENMRDTFKLTGAMRTLVIALGEVVGLVREVSESLQAAQEGLTIGDPPFDLEEVKTWLLHWELDLRERAAGLEGIDAEEVAARLRRSPLGAWLEGLGQGAPAGLAASHQAFLDAVLVAARQPGEESLATCRGCRQRLFQELDAHYRGMRLT